MFAFLAVGVVLHLDHLASRKIIFGGLESIVCHQKLL